MNDSTNNEHSIGAIQWVDLTVDNAEAIRDFYRDVVGWRVEPVEMGDYNDFNMVAPATGQPTAGVCHARGANADLPSKWLAYITVENLTQSIERCQQLGGKVISGPKNFESYSYCVIEDPAGAVCGLCQKT